MSKRSQKVILTPEARALRELRIRSGLSMRAAGEKLGYSSSYISQIENGRENVPTSGKLDQFLRIYNSNMPIPGMWATQSGLMWATFGAGRR